MLLNIYLLIKGNLNNLNYYSEGDSLGLRSNFVYEWTFERELIFYYFADYILSCNSYIKILWKICSLDFYFPFFNNMLPCNYFYENYLLLS